MVRKLLVWFVRNPFLIVLILVSGLIYAYESRFPQVTGTFSEHIYLPVKSELCPGENLTINVNIMFNENVYFRIYRTVVDDVGKVVLTQVGHPAFSIRLKGESFSRILTYDLPPLDPGSYQYRVALVAPDHDPSIFIVPFSVIECN